MAQFPLYEELCAIYRERKYRNYDLEAEGVKINTMLRQVDPETGLILGKIIYALIYHHDTVSEKGSRFRTVAYGGQILSKETGGIKFEMKALPPFLLQLIIIFVDDVLSKQQQQ
jgi:hypothetical protein